MASTRILITVFDALRPDLVTPELMPNLCAFADAGVRYTRARSTFPTETRVNQSALTTGCMPWRHGIVGNKFVADDLLPGRLINSGSDPDLCDVLAAGPLLDVPTLGQRLTAAGRQYASLSAGTGGGGRLINWSAEQDGSFRLAMRAPEATVPSSALDDIVARLGPMPKLRLPATDWISWAVSAYLEYVEPEVRPDVMLLWLCEPDESFHRLGIGAPGALETIRHADAEFGRVLDALGPEIDAGTMQVIALSDHGQITLKGEPLDLPARLAAEGISASPASLDAADCVVAVDTAGGLWLRDRDPALAARVVDWLRAEDWCGPVFTRNGIAGTLSSTELRLEHARAPDISLVLHSDDRTNNHGLPGTTVHDAPYPVGGGCHGGLHPRELHTFLVLGGAAFRPGAVVDAPAGNIDILPTVLTLLGLPVPDGLDGRALAEALASGSDVGDWTDHVLVSQNKTGPRTYLSVTDLGHSRYLNAAWIEK